MKKVIFIFQVLLIFSIAQIALCEDDIKFDQARENLSDEYAQCAAYFRLITYALEGVNDNNIAKGYRELEDSTMLYALVLAQKGSSNDNFIITR